MKCFFLKLRALTFNSGEGSSRSQGPLAGTSPHPHPQQRSPCRNKDPTRFPCRNKDPTRFPCRIKDPTRYPCRNKEPSAPPEAEPDDWTGTQVRPSPPLTKSGIPEVGRLIDSNKLRAATFRSGLAASHLGDIRWTWFPHPTPGNQKRDNLGVFRVSGHSSTRPHSALCADV